MKRIERLCGQSLQASGNSDDQAHLTYNEYVINCLTKSLVDNPGRILEDVYKWAKEEHIEVCCLQLEF
jgi:hypothetical protein